MDVQSQGSHDKSERLEPTSKAEEKERCKTIAYLLIKETAL
jgi:hypothetical protein